MIFFFFMDEPANVLRKSHRLQVAKQTKHTRNLNPMHLLLWWHDPSGPPRISCLQLQKSIGPTFAKLHSAIVCF